MTKLVECIWKLLEEENNKYNENNIFIFHKEKKEAFKKNIQDAINQIKNKYMHKSVTNLDRHKNVALIIIGLLEENVIEAREEKKEYIFIGAELIALKIGLSYMLKQLNEKLTDKGIDKQINNFFYPNAQSCETSYLEIMCRNLFYSRNYYMLNPLDLAERLFLFEYITLIKNNINPDLLKDY